jgi:hypothetical protein
MLHCQLKCLARRPGQHLTALGGSWYSQRGLWEKLLVPRGKRKAGETWQAEARGFWERTREAKGRMARATEDILRYRGKELEAWKVK